jgi:hypothetical protein
LSVVTAETPTSRDRGPRYLLVICYAIGGLVGAVLLALLVLLAVDGHPLPLLAAAVGAVLPFPLRGTAYLLGVPRPPMGRKMSIDPRIEAMSPLNLVRLLMFLCIALLRMIVTVVLLLLVQFTILLHKLREVFGSDRT